MNEKLMTVKDVAELYNFKESWVRNKIFLRKIPFVKLGSLIRFRPDDIEKWIEQNKINERYSYKNK